jgi:type IV pilus assembly protein PilY1
MTRSTTSLLHRARQCCLGLLSSCAFLPAVLSLPVEAAQISSVSMADYTSGPVTTVSQVTPLVMLAMSRDHQYFFKAYNDYSDIDADGVVEETYDDTFTYYGYFHSELCYAYDDGDDRFEPSGATDGTANNHYCTGAQADKFSGNFLNWATMTRMDIVRKILYGGLRSTDSSSLTVVERAHLPTDAHSFAKYYNLDDVDELTPFESVAAVVTEGDGGVANDYNDASEGITICNTSYAASGNSHTSTALPTVRFAYGNRTLWSANERWQCTWENERGDNTNANIPISSGLDVISSDPPNGLALTTAAGDRDRVVRVVVCDSSLFVASNNLENCQRYPSGNLKPTGLLQRYGETGLINFGLVTGSWDKNISGGALRKNVGSMSDEINSTTNGTFKAVPAAGGIINTLNLMRIWGYAYGTDATGSGHGTYFGGVSGDNCGFQLATITQGDCNAWGNPMAEIYLEALRYFAVSSARGPTAAFNPNDTTYFPGMTDASWATDPLDTDNACASLNVIAFNASVSSYDNNATSSTILGGNTPEALTDAVGDGESISNNSYFIGESNAGTDQFCTVKTIDDLGDAYGLCPEGPTLDGSYHMAGLAHYARTNDLRSDLEDDQNVQTFAVALATAVPTIEIPIGPAGSSTIVRALPAYRLVGVNGGGAIVDFKVVRKHTEVSDANLATPGLPNTTPGVNRDIRFDVATNNALYGRPDSCVIGTVGCSACTGGNPSSCTTGGSNGQIASTLPVAAAGTGIYHGKFYLNWEDSEQGGDYDQDMWGTIDYVVDTRVSPATVTITTVTIAESTGNPQLFGFVISGTTKDGFHAYSGIEGANYTDPSGVTGCTNCQVLTAGSGQRGPQSYTFTVGTDTAADVLENPLYYAAKWGGFNDSNDNDIPDLQKEWDVRDQNGEFTTDGNADGVPDGDGIPDNFFFVSNPAALEDALTAVFDLIIERVSSGTAAAVVANDQEGTGAVFQALYDPVKSDSTAAQNEAQWIGTLQALWVDTNGLIREDNDQDAKLDGYDVDKVVEVFFDEVDRRARIRRYDSSSALEFIPVDDNPTPLELPNLQTIWNARERLSDLDNTTVINQRSYTTPVGTGANEGRHILTWFDDDLDDIVATDGSEIVAFTTAAIASGNRQRWLDEDDLTNAQNLVRWIRGQEITGLRNRIVDYDGDNANGGVALHAPSGNPEVQRLGDIIHSTPIPVATPIEAYDLLALDSSYGEFRATYANRRQVVYIGGNDGMIHAFNGGFYNAAERQFEISPDSQTPHPLGAEIWAYVPKNLLPHLQWLARPDYSHVFYMDQTPRVFDAKIFTPSSTHVNGWGTVMVVGMRFGGASDATAIPLDIDDDGTDDASLKSALVVLDITNPELPPEVLAELSPADLNYTTSFPQVVVVGDPIEPGSGVTTSNPNRWFLVFGSGPTNLADATSTQQGRVFAYDLEDLASGRSSLATIDGARITSGPFGTGAGYAIVDENSTFIGDPVVVDLDVDMKAEAIYFGTVGDVDADDGSLWRISIGEESNPINWGSRFKLMDPNQPFISQPSVTIDRTFQTWVMAGTGRLYVNADKLTDSQQSLYGFIDPNPAVGDNGSVLTVDLGDLIDVTAAEVRTNGDVDLDDDGDVDMTFDGLANAVEDAGGWVRNYAYNSPDPSERNVNRSTLIDGVLFNTAFTPSTDLCTSEGTSLLFGLAFNTGTALPNPIFGEIPCAGCPTGVNESSPYVDLGAGLASTPSIHIGNQDIPGKVTVITQKSTGAIETTDATTLGGIANGEISWREYRAY